MTGTFRSGGRACNTRYKIPDDSGCRVLATIQRELSRLSWAVHRYVSNLRILSGKDEKIIRKPESINHQMEAEEHRGGRSLLKPKAVLSLSLSWAIFAGWLHAFGWASKTCTVPFRHFPTTGGESRIFINSLTRLRLLGQGLREKEG